MTIEEARLRFQRLPGFRQVEQIPEGVRHGVKDHQAGIYACPQQCSMKIDGATEAVIARRSHAKSRRESLQIRIDRRKHGIVAVVVADVWNHSQALQGRKHRTEVCETVSAVEKPGVAVAGEIDITGEEAQSGWQREIQPARLNRHLSRQYGTRGRTIDADPFRRVLLEEVPIYCDCIVHRRGKRILWS